MVGWAETIWDGIYGTEWSVGRIYVNCGVVEAGGFNCSTMDGFRTPGSTYEQEREAGHERSKIDYEWRLE